MISANSLLSSGSQESIGLRHTAQAQLSQVQNGLDSQINEPLSSSDSDNNNNNSSVPLIGVNVRGFFTNHAETKNVPSTPFPNDYYDDTFKALSDAGMNHIRYVFRWESYERDPDSFINEILTVAQTASKWGLKVIYDNHQFHTSSWLNNERGLGFPVSLFENNPQYVFDSGGAPNRETAKIWWTNWWNRNITDSAGNEGWTLQAEFLKKIVQTVDGYSSTLGYEILNEPQFHSSEDWEKIGKYNTFMTNELRKSTQKTLFYSMQIPITNRVLNDEHLQVNPENIAKMAPENKTNVVFKISVYRLPDMSAPDTYQARRFTALAESAEIAGVPLYVGEWNNVVREKITNEENATQWILSPEKSDINQTQAVNFVQGFKELGVWGWSYWVWDYREQQLENFNLANITADNRIAPTKYFEYLKNAVAQVYGNASTTMASDNSTGINTRNGTVSSTGVSYSSGDGSIIKNSTLSYNYRGSYATHVSNMIFANNTVANSYQYGYHPRSGAANLQIYGNVIYKSGSHGIICSVLCRDLLIEDNLLYNNSGNGIMLDQLVGNSTVSGNIIYDNDHGGIVIWNSSDNTVVNNLVDDNAYGIIVASSSSNNDIRENIIRTSEENGIFLYNNSTSNLFEENKILQSVGSGIYIRDQSTRDNRFILNTIMKSLESGFLVSNTSQNVMVDNHVFENIKYQYYIKSNSTNNVVMDSIFKNTDIRFFDNSSNLILANNNNLISATNKEMPSGVYTDHSTLVVFPVNKNIVVHTLEMSAIPSSNYVEILPLENSNNNYTINTSWIENALDESISTKYSLGGFPPKKEFIIWVNNIAWSPVTSNSTGYITFIYDGGGFERIFRIEPGLPIDPLSTKIPKIPTIAILILAGIGVLIAVRIFKRRNRAIESI